MSKTKLEFIQNEPFKAFLSLSIPIMVMLIFNEFYNIVDAYFLSQLGNTVIIALGYIDYLFYFISRRGKGIGRGTQSIISRKLGEKDYKKSNEVALSGILLIILLCVIFQLAILFLLPNLLAHIGNKTSIPVIISYITCLSIFVFPLLISEYMTELLNAEGHSQTATNIMAIWTILNIVFDYVLICIFNMGIIGASLGTAIAYVGTFIIFFYMYIIENRFIIKINIRKIKLNSEIFKEVFSNSLPIILDSFVVALQGFIMVLLLGFIAHPIVVVAFNLLAKFEGLMSIPSHGLSRSCNIVSDHLFGAKRFEDVKKNLKIQLYSLCYFL